MTLPDCRFVKGLEGILFLMFLLVSCFFVEMYDMEKKRLFGSVAHVFNVLFPPY